MHLTKANISSLQQATGCTIKSGKIIQPLSIESPETGKWHHEFGFFQEKILLTKHIILCLLPHSEKSVCFRISETTLRNLQNQDNPK